MPKLQDLSLPAYEGIYNQRLRDFITRHADQLSSLTITVSAQETGQHDWTVGSFACLNLPFPNLIRLVIYVQRGLPPHFELLRMITPHLPNLKAFAFQAYWMSRDDILALFGAPVGLETLEMEFEGFDFETASALQRSLPRLHRLKLILHTPSFDEAIKSLPPVSQSVSESGFIVNEVSSLLTLPRIRLILISFSGAGRAKLRLVVEGGCSTLPPSNIRMGKADGPLLGLDE